MGEDNEFRIGMWPGDQIPVPQLFVSEAWLEEGEFIHFGPYLTDNEEEAKAGGFEPFGDNHYVDRLPEPGKRITLPEEFYLRELGDLNVDDPEEVLAFTNTWGLLGKPGMVEIGHPFFVIDHSRAERASSLEERNSLKNEAERLVTPHFREKESWKNRQFVHFLEIAVHVRLIRDLWRINAVLAAGRDLGVLKADWESAWLPRPERERDAQAILVDYLSHALGPFHVTLFLRMDDGSSYQPEKPTLFAAACLQLANDVVAGQPYRRCQNCGRPFIIQRGRAVHGQHRREGVIRFCSSSCAKARAQRDLYRRQVEARRLHQEGKSVKAIAESLGAKTDSVARWVKAG